MLLIRQRKDRACPVSTITSMTLFDNKYRVESTRLKHWNYANNGMYFITICTDDKIRHFGEIIDENVLLNKLGKFAVKCWKDIPNHFPFVKLDEFVIMPNHVHGIIGIDKPDDNLDKNNVETRPATSNVETGHTKANVETLHNVKTRHALPLPHPRFRNQGNNTISAMVGSFKSAVTKYANKNDIQFKWQTRFHDRVIRGENELFNIQRYIIENPLKWKLDKYYLN